MQICSAAKAIIRLFALAKIEGSLYKDGQGSTHCLGVWKPLLGG